MTEPNEFGVICILYLMTVYIYALPKHNNCMRFCIFFEIILSHNKA